MIFCFFWGVLAVDPAPANAFEQFLDRQYSDDYIERRWTNMIVTGDP